jgi:molybdate transport system ATP-binding protein
MSDGGARIGAAFRGRVGAFSLDVAFTAPMRGVTALFGPSGCGKTTVLRCIAGLRHLAGTLRVGGESWQDDQAGVFRRPHRRPVGYVFQEPSLFSHLSVRRNLAYGARRAGDGGPLAGPGFDDVVALLGIAPLLERSPAALSGGERQRVAVGRALLSRPRLLLMDEPLAALDRPAREEILPCLEALHERLEIPILYVSHDIAEVERLADTMVLMDRGRVIASGALTDLEADPTLPLLAAPEAAVTLEGEVVSIDEPYALTVVSAAGARLVVPGLQGAPGARRRLRIRASDVSFTRVRPAETSILNCLAARIVSVSAMDDGGAQVNIVAALGADGAGARIVGRVTRKSQEMLDLRPGAPVFAQIKSVALLASGADRRGGRGTGVGAK